MSLSATIYHACQELLFCLVHKGNKPGLGIQYTNDTHGLVIKLASRHEI